MAGGDLSEPTLVSEQYLLDIEREELAYARDIMKQNRSGGAIDLGV
jgi:hypothetical protein